MNSRREFVEIKIGSIFDFPETNSKITKKYCNNNRGIIPVYASSKDPTSTLGAIKDNIKGVKYYSDCLSWNRNGSVGYVFLRDHRFATNEDHRAMVVKDEYKHLLDKKYLKFEIERQLLLNGFSYLDKCGVAKIQAVDIFVPVSARGNFDIDEQRRLADQYIGVENIKRDLRELYDNISNVNVEVNSTKATRLFGLDELFLPEKGDAKYTQKYVHNNPGIYPVYSSQTSKLGQFGTIDSYDFDQECFTWTTDGVYAGTVFYRNGKFSITTHCGVLVLKPKYKGKVSLSYINFKLNEVLPNNTLGEGANRRLGIQRIKELFIELPVDASEQPDIDEQAELASKYEKIGSIKSRIKEDRNKLMDSKVGIIDDALISVIQQ